MNKDNIIKQIPIDQLASFLEQGWSKGKGKTPWNKGLTKETDIRVKQYGESQQGKVISEEAKEKIRKKLTGRKIKAESISKMVQTRKEFGLNKHSEETKQKISQSLLGHKITVEQIEKQKQTMITRYGGFIFSKTPTEEGIKRISQHNSSKEFQEYQRKIKIQNGTINTSKPEIESFKKLQEVFGENNVLRYYCDERYPYECDAYIKNLDLFIEFNYHWTHGKHPFDINNLDDRQTLALWKSKQNLYINDKGKEKKNSYYIAEKVWTIKDVEKLNCFKNNNLNYLIFYKEKDFNEWINKR